MSDSPTKRSLALCRDTLGMTVQVVERWNSFAKRRIDLFGIIDLVAISPETGILGIQATSRSNHSARRSKALAEPNVVKWLEAGGKLEIWSWGKSKVKAINTKGQPVVRKRWGVWREEITIPMVMEYAAKALAGSVEDPEVFSVAA